MKALFKKQKLIRVFIEEGEKIIKKKSSSDLKDEFIMKQSSNFIK